MFNDVLFHNFLRTHKTLQPSSIPTPTTDGYSMSDIIYFWKDGEKSIGIDESLTLPQFSVAGIKQRDKKVVLSTGNYSRLLCEIQLIRSMGYYMIQVSILNILVSNRLKKILKNLINFQSINSITNSITAFRSTCPPR